MLIRPIKDSDVPAIADIYNENWKITYRNLLPDSFLNGMTHEHSRDKWLKYLHTISHGGFVALDEKNQVIGFSAYKPYTDLENCILLDSLHIKKSAQGKGIGKALVLKIGEYACKSEYKKMAICIVKGNDRAERIYTHLGARFYKDFIDSFEGTPSNSTLLVWDDLSIFKSI
ncbi:MAG: GNAT family N-acetyltransferase [Peptostreptococcaceae bacterium]|nr:GNAT family N-acetyltransferase [Peptostreptococcaceae bacterium]